MAGSIKSVSIGALGSLTLTRRTATVTISAPLAATAAAFWAKSLYLPVPTISREVNVRPATVQVSDSVISATHKMDDLQRIAFGQRDFAQCRARDDHAVALHRDLGRIEFEAADQIGNRAGRGAAGFAVDGEGERCGHAARR